MTRKALRAGTRPAGHPHSHEPTPANTSDTQSGTPPAEGTLFLVVGPSGAGKDTLIDGARAALAGDPAFAFARRVVTRPAEAGGEAHEAMDEASFAAAERAGAFLASWGAHGLFYGVRQAVREALGEGRNVVVNGSRREIAAFEAAAARVVVLSITAPPDIVAARLRARGREDASAVAARLSRAVPIRAHGPVIEIANNATADVGVARFLAALLGAAHLPLTLAAAPVSMGREAVCFVARESLCVRAGQLGAAERVDVVAGSRRVRARLALCDAGTLVGPGEAALSAPALERLGLASGSEVTVQRARAAGSRDLLRAKVAGCTLETAEIEQIALDLVAGNYSEGETAGFLVAAAQSLTTSEVIALTRVRAALGNALVWDRPLVVDKHSLGGVPGSRISMIAVPIAAAHGLLVPKISSRAITSAAGTADVMECAARVDLTRADMGAAIAAAGATIAWNGRISHSPLDDVMNAINRPLGIRSALLDVSSILSKKLLAGATHVVIDIPAGRGAKTETRAEAAKLATLFETVGSGVGLTVRAFVTDGSRVIGTAVGPALELIDVRAVLEGAAGASAALREKALDFAAEMLAFDPSVPVGTGRARAESLLESGAALSAFEAIVDAQGRRQTATPGPFVRTICASRSGTVAGIDGPALGALARAAGAPEDKGAGVRVIAPPGAQIVAGAPVLEVVASHQDALDWSRTVDGEAVVSIG
ncbi:phosphonate metabolism protein/1,5-bisphosphokinase (PRPP-forming) PhnN [Acuticoccus sp. MNP-M23]|uniref:phosphonate metabolism protein/1,5-bisphosphokinase (PRPP-forming) PhnN n=1 Tax=Acuticoccus sp. MNP-M23 TaxID=3072793 RepID=UPI0028159215|nr:phosphonate metabolism protein/1,5-bisphosphokinase (PRPP-forming) PhnN [Acuticoccus sp. MNP-M23]WMS41067.1 phosphonate metabolism protein/1,5-bisphosphokinase (PRPP-forming) PhnN [Acuticoccus sp. MNP-M23]